MEVLTSTTLDRARQIVQHAHAISPSASLLRLEQQLRQGDSNARQLAKLIDGSPALAARVLRMANSAFYAPAEPVTTLSRAVALLGDTVLRQLVLTSLIVSRRAGNRSPREALAAARLTGDAVRAAVVGKTLAQMSRSSIRTRPSPPAFFMTSATYTSSTTSASDMRATSWTRTPTTRATRPGSWRWRSSWPGRPTRTSARSSPTNGTCLRSSPGSCGTTTCRAPVRWVP
jgi:hypothetical protein